jgi:type I restriction enzyme S subunit
MSDFGSVPFEQAFVSVPVGNRKIQESEYKTTGSICVVDQGQRLVSGCTNRNDLCIDDGPYIVFGDHTRTVKYIDFPFVAGADGVRLYKAAASFEPEFLYLFLSGTKLPMDGYGRHSKHLKNLFVPNISRQQQRQIAARLKAQLVEVETARQAMQTQLKEIDTLRAAIYRDAFEHIVPVALTTSIIQPQSDWQWRKLTDIACLESGHTPSRLRPDWWGGDVSWVSLTEIRVFDGQWVESTQIKTNAAGIANSAARILPCGTVCFSRTASVGFVTIMAAPMATSQDFANWVCGDELEPEFLMYALIRSRKELRDLAVGATHKTIYMPTLGAFHLYAPDINEQRRIAARLKAQLAEVAVIQQAAAAQLSEIERLPQRILAQTFDTHGK